MKKYLFGVILIMGIIIIAQIFMLKNIKAEKNRFEANQAVLLADTAEYYKAKNGQLAAYVERLELTKRELVQYCGELKNEVKNLKIKLRDVKSITNISTEIQIEPIEPIPLRNVLPISDSIKRFDWQDKWAKISGTIQHDSINPRFETIVPLIQIVHRIPKKFLGIRIGTKGIGQTITTSNPYAKIIFERYIELK